MGKLVLDRSFLTGTSDFGMVERTSATISGVGDPVIPAADLSTFKYQFRGTRLQKREKLEFAVRTAVAKFGMYEVNGWRDICSALRVEALISKRNAGHELNKTLINRRRQHVPKCSVRPYDPNFICIL